MSLLKIGHYNTLRIAKSVDFGMYLESDRGEILLPTKYLIEGLQPGDMIDVFIYRDSEDRIIATTLKPSGIVGDFVLLKVKDVNQHGAFLDWGLEKDLFVPFSEQHKRMVSGNEYIVRICIDPKTERIIGISKLASFLSHDTSELKVGEEVDLLVYELTDLGYMCIINQRFKGMLYKNEVFRPLMVGDCLKGFIKKVREDGKVDLILSKPILDEIDDSKEIILLKLKENNGELRFSDKTAPEEIKAFFHLSKKNFKRGIGSLYKEQKITIEEDKIRLLNGG